MPPRDVGLASVSGLPEHTLRDVVEKASAYRSAPKRPMPGKG